MDVLIEVPERVLDEVPEGMEQVFAEELVSALNCCRKYRRGTLVVAPDSNLGMCVAIRLKGKARVFRALQAMNKWLDVEDIFELLGSMSGLPRACSAIQYIQRPADSGPF